MIDPEQLRELLEVLREEGVSQFSCPEFSCSLLPNAPGEFDEDIGTAIREAQEAERLPSVARGIFGHPSLWPSGRPPTFPTDRQRETKPTHPDEE
jgi:hypothetical protein